MPIPIGSRVAVSYRYTWNDQRMLLTLAYNVTATASANTVIQDLGTIAGTFTSVAPLSILDRFRTCLPSNATVNFCRVQQIIPSRSVYLDTNINLAGQDLNAASTGNIQLPVTLHTAAGGRNQVSVKKIGPVPDTRYADGAATNAFLTTAITPFAQGLIATQITLAPAITLVPVVPHPLTVDDPIVGFRLPTRVGVMHRRTVRVGE